LVVFLSYRALKPDPFVRPRKSDALPAVLAFIGLALISTILGYGEAFMYPAEEPYALPDPLSALDWLVVVVSCVSTGYLEESYFRAYLLTRFEGLRVPAATGIAVSVFLFALCHLYEGPWGVLNAAAAGALLSFVFLRTRSVHAASWAHAAYNIFVWASF